MSIVNMHEAKSTLSRLVERIEGGEETEIIIARNGKPAARLVPLKAEVVDVSKRIGLLEGQYPDFDFEAFQALDKEVALLFAGSTINPQT